MSGRHLVTGAGSGIGAAVAIALTERGDDLWLLARSEESAHRIAAAFPHAHVLVGELDDPVGLEASLHDAVLPLELDSLLHIAGVVELGSVAEQSAEHVLTQLRVNAAGPMVLTRALLPALRAAHGLVLVANSGAGLRANPDWSAYAASKFAAKAFADALRAEEASNGIRVTTVYPGRTATPMQQKVHDQEHAAYDADRWIRPETVAQAILNVIDLPADAVVPDLTISPRAPRS